MISEGSCDTEDCTYELYHVRNKLHYKIDRYFTKLILCFKILTVFCYQINAALVRIIDFFKNILKHHTDLKLLNGTVWFNPIKK